MLITVKCGKCEKRYKVDSKLGGKRVKCKNCSSVINIPQASVDETPSDDLLAGLTAAAHAENSAKASGEVDLAPRAGSIRAAPSGEPCPECGAPFPAEHRICLSCGLNRATGKKMQTVADRPTPAAKGRGPAKAGGGRQNLDYASKSSAVRQNVDYENTFAHLVDTWVPKLAMGAYIAGTLVILALPFIISAYIGRAPNPKGAVLYCITILFASGTYLAIPIPLAILGIRIAGKILRFELPENTLSRYLASGILPALVWFGMVYFLVPSMSGILAGSGGLSSPGVSALAMLGSIAISFVVALVAHFFPFWFFFRLKILEALLGYLFMAIFSVIGGITWSIVLSVFGFVMGKAFG